MALTLMILSMLNQVRTGANPIRPFYETNPCVKRRYT